MRKFLRYMGHVCLVIAAVALFNYSLRLLSMADDVANVAGAMIISALGIGAYMFALSAFNRIFKQSNKSTKTNQKS